MVAALGAARLRQLEADPDVFLLRGGGGAEWIVADLPFELHGRLPEATQARFRTRFEVVRAAPGRALLVQAFRRCEVRLDGRALHADGERAAADWKRARRVALPADLEPGAHVLEIVVLNESAPAALRVRGEGLDVASGARWEASTAADRWAPARPASQLPRPALAARFPPAPRAFASVAPWLAPLFAAVFFWTWRVGRDPGTGRELSSRALRFLLLGLWIGLGANDAFAIPTEVGFDVAGHIEYIVRVATLPGLPMPGEGWQAFQPPLYYLLSAPLFHAFSGLPPDTAVMAMRVLPIACGLLLVELSWRCARIAFAGRDDLCALATLTAGLLPMGLYLCQVLGNEPLGAALSALVLLGCFALVAGPGRATPVQLAALGVAWGLALLAKATPVLLAPAIAASVLWHRLARGERWRGAGTGVLLVFAAAALTAGWYYARNWLALGKPFVGGWDPARGIRWWQDPGYRTAEQLASFGASLARPVYSGSASFWDSVYSSLWLDGFQSGMALFAHRPPWHAEFMVAGAWLGIVPTLLLFAGIARAVWGPAGASRRAARLAAGCVLVYLFAMAELYLRLPIYSTAKASYTLGLLPCYGILVATGAEPLLRFPVLRALLAAWMACWGAAAYVAYLV